MLAIHRPPEYRIALSAGQNAIGWTIRKATKSKFSHVAIRRTDEDSDLVFEAWGGHRCSLRPYAVYLDRKATILKTFRVDWDASRLQEAWDWSLREFCDDRYAWAQLLGDQFAIWADKIDPEKRHRNPFASRALVCSELVGLILKRAGAPGFQRIDMERVSPQDEAVIFADCPRVYIDEGP